MIYPYLKRFCVFSHFIRSKDRSEDFFGCDFQRHIVDGFTFGAGRFRHLQDASRLDRLNPHIRKCDRKSHLKTKINDFEDFVFRCVFKHELSDRSESDFFTVVQMVAFFHDRKSVVDRMGSSQSRTFKADSAEDRICFDDLFDRLRADTGFEGELCFESLAHQSVKAEFCKCHRSERGGTAGAARRMYSTRGGISG